MQGLTFGRGGVTFLPRYEAFRPMAADLGAPNYESC